MFIKKTWPWVNQTKVKQIYKMWSTFFYSDSFRHSVEVLQMSQVMLFFWWKLPYPNILSQCVKYFKLDLDNMQLCNNNWSTISHQCNFKVLIYMSGLYMRFTGVLWRKIYWKNRVSPYSVIVFSQGCFVCVHLSWVRLKLLKILKRSG